MCLQFAIILKCIYLFYLMLIMDFVAPAQKSYCAEVASVSASLNFTLLFAELFSISISFSNDFLSF